MMELKLIRDLPHDDCTLGKLYINGNMLCYTVEDSVREIPGQPVEQWKVHGKTAIPTGKYKVELTFSQRFQKILPLLIEVPGFAGVRIHAGNTAADTEGCIIVGLHRTDNGVADSRKAMDMFMKILDGEENISIMIL